MALKRKKMGEDATNTKMLENLQRAEREQQEREFADLERVRQNEAAAELRAKEAEATAQIQAQNVAAAAAAQKVRIEAELLAQAMEENLKAIELAKEMEVPNTLELRGV